MRRSVFTCFDEVVAGTTSVYTAPQFNDHLGAFDKLAVQAIIDQSTGSSLTFAIDLEASNDQRNWVQKTVNFITATPSTTATVVAVGTDAGTTPTMAFVRLKITLGGTNPVMHVKLVACPRDEA